MRLKLISEKKGFLDHFNYGKILGVFLISLALPTFLIVPFLAKDQLSWYLPYCIFLFLLFIVSWFIMNVKYYSSYDYDILGEIQLLNDKIILQYPTETREFSLEKTSINLLYNGIRNIGFHYGRDFPRSGISEITLNNEEKVYTIIKNEEEFELLKKTLKTWYSQNFTINEFTRTKEHYRLIELEKNFEWNKLTDKMKMTP